MFSIYSMDIHECPCRHFLSSAVGIREVPSSEVLKSWMPGIREYSVCIVCTVCTACIVCIVFIVCTVSTVCIVCTVYTIAHLQSMCIIAFWAHAFAISQLLTVPVCSNLLFVHHGQTVQTCRCTRANFNANTSPGRRRSGKDCYSTSPVQGHSLEAHLQEASSWWPSCHGSSQRHRRQVL